ncbi:MAG: hypothetical protein JW724_06320 [Candidatus Altiarchaeota archaeon]|nr:hypothetical protein [Candidatus Altiarchaeota archaeon]
MESSPRQCSADGQTFTEELIGGGRDEHGCLGPAGYSYDEDVGACTRSWELDEDQKKAAKMAIAPLSSTGWTVVEVTTLRCVGCFNVLLQNGDAAPVMIRLADWKVIGSGYERPVACTREYAPVCGLLAVACVTTPCEPVFTTYSNRCEAEAAGAYNIIEGACEQPQDPQGACLSFDGNWLEEYGECEGMPREQCVALGGTFDGCASACRHDPAAQICTMQCVQVCSNI